MQKRKDLPRISTTNIKSSFYIRPDYTRALEAIWRNRKVLKSHQVEMGLAAYFESHKDFLLSVGIDLWSGK